MVDPYPQLKPNELRPKAETIRACHKRQGAKGDLFLRHVSLHVRDAFKANCARFGIPMNAMVEYWMRLWLEKVQLFDLAQEKNHPRGKEILETGEEAE